MSALIPSRRPVPQAENAILNLSFYKFIRLNDLQVKREHFLKQCETLGLRGSILIASEGINGFIAGAEKPVRAFISFLNSQPGFSDIVPKESWSSHVPFTRMIVKVKKEIITMGVPDIDPEHFTGKRVYPKELKSWLDEKRDVVLLDTRNDYEIKDGTFKGAEDYGIETFRQFPEKLKSDVERLKDKTVVMFCTGGIRCEKSTALALQYGLKDVYQLEGGILKYLEETGGAHWKGDCFVFDGRGAVDANLSGATDRSLKKKIGTMIVYVDTNDHRLCPDVLRLKMTLEEKGLPYTIVQEDPKNLSQGFLESNPSRHFPAFRHNDLSFYKPSIIGEYLDELFEYPKLMPEKADRRARVRLWADWCDTEFAPLVMKWLTQSAECSEDEVKELDDRLIRALYKIQSGAQRRDFLVSAQLTLADIHLFPFVWMLHVSSQKPTEYARFEKLFQWIDRVKSRPSFQKFSKEFHPLVRVQA